MLEYFAYKKYKKHKAEKELKEEATVNASSSQNQAVKDTQAKTGPDASASRNSHTSHLSPHHSTPAGNPVLRPDDETFLEHLLADDETPPPLPPRPLTPVLDAASDIDAEDDETTAQGNQKQKDAEQSKDEKKSNRLSLLFTRHKKASDGLKPEDAVPPQEADRERKDLGNVLDRLNLTAKNNKVMTLTNDSADLLQRFNQVFKDLVNGVPTAYGDLTKLFDERDGAISKGFEKLPASLKKLVTQLPDKLTNSFAPEILAAAAEAQGLQAASSGGMKATAKKMLQPNNLADLVTKPGAIVGMLRAIVETLKARWPAFLGMNVIWTVALTLLLFVLWYCHKRGREARLEREKSQNTVEAGDRIEELPDDPALPPIPTSESREGVASPALEASNVRLPSGTGTPSEPATR